MKILITCCGVGIGHASRDVAIAKMLEKHGHMVKFASYGAGLHYLRKNNYEPYILPEMNFTTEDGEIKIEKTIMNSKDIPLTFVKTMYKESKIIKEINPDLIISDCDYSIPITSKILGIPCYLITNDLTFGFSKSTTHKSIKYFEKGIGKFIIEISKGCKKILIPDVPGSCCIPPNLESKVEFIGPILHMDINDLPSKESLRIIHNQSLNESILLLTVGGSEFGQTLICNICDIYEKINIDKIIIFTGLEIDVNNIKIPQNQSKIVIKEFTYHMLEWMKLSDLTVALAGHTTSMELTSIKKPNILIPLKNHVEQERNVENVLKYELTSISHINDENDLLNIINSTIANLDNIKVNEELYENFIKYNGRENALKIIENLI